MGEKSDIWEKTVKNLTFSWFLAKKSGKIFELFLKFQKIFTFFALSKFFFQNFELFLNVRNFSNVLIFSMFFFVHFINSEILNKFFLDFQYKHVFSNSGFWY